VRRTSAPVALAAAGVALVLVGMLAVLVALLISLEGTRSEIRTTRAGVVAADRRFARLAGELEPLLRVAAPLTADDGRRRLGRAATRAAASIDELPGLADRAREGVDAATFLATTLERSRVPGTLSSVRRTLPDALAVLRSQRRLTRVSTVTQRQQLAIITRTFALLSESLGIQRELLDRTRSIDRKTGGPAPATPLP
jgi:hypothetical protein